jgi:hypothetical protein
MKQILVVLGLAALLSPASQAADAACEVAALIGSARAGGQSLKLGSPLAVGSEVQTDANSRLRMTCRDGSSMVVGAASRLRIEAFEMNGAQRSEARFQLAVGLIGQKVAAGGGWNVRTPTAVTAVRGTEYIVEVKEDQATAVLMQSGSVDVRAAGPQSRSLAAALPLIALAGALGTDCRSGQCTAAAPWSAERVKALTDRLAGI